MSCSMCLCQATKDATYSTLSGYITDASTGEPLAGASLKYANSNAGVISNKYGFFSLTSETGSLRRVSVSYVGYVTWYVDWHFARDSVMRIELTPETALLQEVAIEGEPSGHYVYKAGKAVFSSEKIRNFSSFGSEPDVMKSLQMLPGVQTGNEGTTNISVRGGSFDQNLILLDEAPVYNPSHALSFFSVFNIDALQSVDFYKGGIPVRYGGRLSSVVDIRMKEGNRAEQKSRGSVGVIASKLTTEGPISHDGRWSYMASGRYSYAGQIVNGIYLLGQHVLNDPTANRSTTDNKIRFYDLNAKINFNFNDRNHFFLSAYSGGDRFQFNNITTGYDLAWGNETMTLRWNHVYNKKLFTNTSLVSSGYDYEYKILNNTQYFRWSAELNELQLKQDYDWYVNDNNHITFGFTLQRYVIHPGLVMPRSESSASVQYKLEAKQALAPSLYVGNSSAISSAFQIDYGIRYSGFTNYGKRTEYIYHRSSGGVESMDSLYTSNFNITHRFEPRASLSYMIGTNTFSLSYDRTVQFLHLLSNSSVGLPTDIWWPSSNNIKPQHADIYAVSWATELRPALYFELGAFYKSMHNVADFRDNARTFANKHIESELLQGDGTSYGLEFFASKSRGKLTGSLSYTLSKTFNKIEGINDGDAYPNRYDKRHSAFVALHYALSDRVTLNSNFVMSSGGAITMPAGSFSFDRVQFNLYTERNGFRLPLYHRLDLSFQYANPERNKKRRFKHYWSLDIYNAYGHRNPFTIYSLQNDHGFQYTETRALYLYRIVPTLSFNFEF
ncbi:MAG TPA: carboxypeptidase-like regulatory domain-containing protein [Chryseosolibacter sp.]|nr:carboxypeptidase-like regulatory domain-containing protein [Chryseosolibacter sp.]